MLKQCQICLYKYWKTRKESYRSCLFSEDVADKCPYFRCKDHKGPEPRLKCFQHWWGATKAATTTSFSRWRRKVRRDRRSGWNRMSHWLEFHSGHTILSEIFLFGLLHCLLCLKIDEGLRLQLQRRLFCVALCSYLAFDDCETSKLRLLTDRYLGQSSENF